MGASALRRSLPFAAVVLAAVWSTALSDEDAPGVVSLCDLRRGEFRRVDAPPGSVVAFQPGVVGELAGSVLVHRPIDDPAASLVQVLSGRLHLGGRAAGPGRIVRLGLGGRLAFGARRALTLLDVGMAGRIVPLAACVGGAAGTSPMAGRGNPAASHPGRAGLASAFAEALDACRRAEEDLAAAAAEVALRLAPLARERVALVALGFGSAHVRARVVKALPVAEVVALGEVLRAALDDPDPRVVEAVLAALARAGDLDALEVLARESGRRPVRLDPAVLAGGREVLLPLWAAPNAGRHPGAARDERPPGRVLPWSVIVPAEDGGAAPVPRAAAPGSGRDAPPTPEAVASEIALHAAGTLAAGPVRPLTVAASCRVLDRVRAAGSRGTPAEGLLDSALDAWLAPGWPAAVRLRALDVRLARSPVVLRQRTLGILAGESGLLGFAAAAALGEADRVRAGVEAALCRPVEGDAPVVLEAFAMKGTSRLDLETTLGSTAAAVLECLPSVSDLVRANDAFLGPRVMSAGDFARLRAATDEVLRLRDVALGILEGMVRDGAPADRATAARAVARIPCARSLELLAAMLDLESADLDVAVLDALAGILGSGGTLSSREPAAVRGRARAGLELLSAALVFPGGR